MKTSRAMGPVLALTLTLALGAAGAGRAAAAAPAKSATAAQAKAAPAPKSARHSPLPFIHDDYTRALAEARSRDLPLFIESWAPW